MQQLGAVVHVTTPAAPGVFLTLLAAAERDIEAIVAAAPFAGTSLAEGQKRDKRLMHV